MVGGKPNPGTEVTWSAPGPGPWMLEASHCSRPMSVYMGEIFPRAMPEGFSRCCERYGLLIEGIRMACVGHFLYVQIVPVGGPVDAEGPPPKWLFKLMLKLHPALRKRIRRCGEVLAERTWQREIDEWNGSIKPEMVARNRALQAVDLASLDNVSLFGHLTECRDQLYDALVSHHTLSASTAVPVGRYLTKTTSWTDLPEQEVLILLRGASPSSIGMTDELRSVVKTLKGDDGAMAVLTSAVEPAAVLEQLMSAASGVGEAMRAYLDVVGNRLGDGYDVADRRVIEAPEVLLRGLAVSLGDDQPIPDVQPQIDAVRARVPPEYQPEFDRLLADAKLTHEIRDERIILGDSWATGLTRRAILEAGRRLTESGQIKEPENLVDATHDEIGALLMGGDQPDSKQLAARHQSRLDARVEDMPPFLGGEPGAPPPDDWLPAAAREVMSGMGAFLSGVMGQTAVKSEAVAEKQSANRKAGNNIFNGLGASGGSYEGPARVITSPEHMNQIQQGEVLVVTSTSPAFNVVLPLLGAIVTERGGMLCHAAVVAREYDIPAVAGVPGSTRQIMTGQMLRVDGTAGTVEVMS